MRNKVLLAIVALLAAVSVGHAQPQATHESIIKEFVKIMEDATAGLNGVKDKATLDKASKLLKDQTAQLDRMTKDGKKLEKPTKEVRDELDKKYGKKAEALGEQFAKAAFGVVGKLGGLDVPETEKNAFLKSMENWGKSMENLAKVLTDWGV